MTFVSLVSKHLSQLLGWKTAVLFVCLLLIYRLLPRPNRWRRELAARMEKTMKRTQLCIEEKKGKKLEKLLPKLVSLEDTGTHHVFLYELIPGMSIKQFVEKKPFFEAAFNAETYISGSGSQMMIKIEKEKHQSLSL